jgi:hypothetical protein
MAISEQNILGSFLPTVYISKITLHNTKVDLELVMIDTNEKDSVTSIINDRVLNDCIDIKLYQTSNENDTRDLEKGLSRTDLSSDIIKIKNSSYSEIDEEGNKKYYYNISYPHTLKTVNQLEHLSYIVYSDVNNANLREAFGISIPSNILNEIPRKISSDTVIDNFEVVSKTYVYFLNDGSAWGGEVVAVNGNYTTLEQQPRELNEVQIPNYKIQDFRIRTEVNESMIINQEILDDVVSRSINITQTANISANRSQPATFTSISKIVNDDRSVSIAVSINTRQLLGKNCLYPQLLTQEMYDDPNLISGMSLWRRQIKSVGSNTNKDFVDTIENIEPLLIANDFVSSQINIPTLPGKHFLINDRTISTATAGIYQYGISIKLYDPTINSLKNKLISAFSVRKNIEEYYKFCEAYTDANTGKFEPEVVSVWSIIAIDNHVDTYVNLLKSRAEPSKINTLITSLKTHVSPVLGSLEGIAMFIKMLDDMISDTSKMLSITNINFNNIQINQSSIELDSVKSLLEITEYFISTIHDASQVNKLELKYFREVRGIVDAEQFSSRIYSNSKNTDEIFVSPSAIYVGNKQINFADLDSEPTESIKKQKYLLLKNKILNIENNKDLYLDSNDINILTDKSVSSSTKNTIISETSNALIDQYLFSVSSMTVTESPTGSLKTDKLSGLNRVLFPENIVEISKDIPVNILSENNIIDLNSDEDLFKYRLLNKVLYADYDTEAKTTIWRSLTLNKITETKSNTINLLCKLEPYDYGLIQNTEIKNINEFYYNKTFVLNLDNFSFVRQQRTPASAPTTPAPTVSPPARLSIIADKNILAFPTTKVGQSSKIDFSISISGVGSEDLYCTIENESQSSLFTITPRTFPINGNGTAQNISITYMPTDTTSVATNLVIRAQKSGVFLNIPITAKAVPQTVTIILERPIATPVSNIPVINTDLASNRPTSVTAATANIRNAVASPAITTNIPVINTDLASNRPTSVTAATANIRDAVASPTITTNIPDINTDLASNRPTSVTAATANIRDAAKSPVVKEIPVIKTDVVSSKPVNPVNSTTGIRTAVIPSPNTIPVILKETGKPIITPAINRTTLNVARTRKP